MYRFLAGLAVGVTAAVTGLNLHRFNGYRTHPALVLCLALAAALVVTVIVALAAALRSRRRPAADAPREEVLACLAFLRGLTGAVPTGVFDALRDGYETTGGTPAHDAAEHKALHAAPWPPELVQAVMDLAEVCGAAADAALVVIAADHLTVAETRLLADPWRRAGLPLLAQVPLWGLDDPVDRAAPVPFTGAGALPASRLAQLGQLLQAVGRLDRAAWTYLGQSHTDRVGQDPAARLRATTAAKRSGRAAAVEFATWAVWLPQFAADAALALLVADLISLADRDLLAGTWMKVGTAMAGDGAGDGRP